MIVLRTIWIYICNSTVTLGAVEWNTVRYTYFEF